MKLVVKSKKLHINTVKNNDNVHLFNQFFIPKTQDRYNEIKFCLKKCVENTDIDFIHLLVEKIYTMATEKGLIYGILAVFFALVFGFTVNETIRRFNA